MEPKDILTSSHIYTHTNMYALAKYKVIHKHFLQARSEQFVSSVAISTGSI